MTSPLVAAVYDLTWPTIIFASLVLEFWALVCWFQRDERASGRGAVRGVIIATLPVVGALAYLLAIRVPSAATRRSDARADRRRNAHGAPHRPPPVREAGSAVSA